MSVIYPEGLVLTEDQHRALAAQDLHAQSGEMTEEGQAQAQALHDSNQPDVVEPTASEDEPETETPDSSWTVAQLDAYATRRGVADYPSSGTKADKLAAIEAQ